MFDVLEGVFVFLFLVKSVEFFFPAIREAFVGIYYFSHVLARASKHIDQDAFVEHVQDKHESSAE